MRETSAPGVSINLTTSCVTLGNTITESVLTTAHPNMPLARAG